MNRQPTPEKLGLQAFPNDFDYLAAELEWIGARVQRIASQQWLDELRANQVEQGIRDHTYTGRITPERVAFLRAEEDAIRQSIDTRLKKNRIDGPDLGLERLCREHGLGDVGLVPQKWTPQLCCHGSARKDKPFVIDRTQVPV